MIEERGYADFAAVYDLLTENVPYDEIAEYYARFIREITSGNRVLDMGCGTGNLTIRLARRGFDMIGLDGSAEMLSFADEKMPEIQWICQNMAEADIGEEADAVISTLDSINHLENPAEIEACFKRAANCLKTGGAFVFDVNTLYKHREILADNTFVYDVDGAYCVWQNEFREKDGSVLIDLDIFFEEEDGSYTRGGESFAEIAFPEEEIRRMLENSGFEIVGVYEYLTFEKPSENSEKLLFSARKR